MPDQMIYNVGKSTASEQDHPDNRFIKGISENDRSLLKEIYQLFLPRIIQFVQLNSGTREDALDIFQEAIMIIYKKAKAGDLVISRSFYNYLYTVCKNLWLRELDKKKSALVSSSNSLIDTYKGFEDSALDIETQIAERALYKLYLDKFKALGEGCRQVLKHFFAGASMKSIAQDMGFASEGYAKKRKHMCQKKLVESIKKDPQFKELF